MTEMCFGKIVGYDPEKRLYVVSTEDGRKITGCRKVGDITSNTGGRKVGELENQVFVLLVLRYNEYNVDAPEGFIIGGIETYSSKDLGTEVEKESQDIGVQGFINRLNRRILLYPDGTIELRAGAMCEITLDPEDRSLTAVFQNTTFHQSMSNYLRWIIHPESEDLKDTVFQLGISGQNALSKEIPDIEILAGALYRLNENFLHSDNFKIDPGAKVAIRITDPDVDKQVDVFHQIGTLEDGDIVKTTVSKKDSIEATTGIGDNKDGSIIHSHLERENGVSADIAIGNMSNKLVGKIYINDFKIQIYEDGKFNILNPKSEIEGDSDGTLNVICKKFSIGSRNAINHIATLEDIKTLLDALINAISLASYVMPSPVGITTPAPVNMPQFTAIQTQLQIMMKSKVHMIDK